MTNRYFAYGSNLNTQDWHRWCRERGFPEGLLHPLFPAFLPDRGLAFTVHSSSRQGGVLDIVPRLGHLVEGVVFEVAEGGWAALDQKEGAPSFYRALDMEVLTFDGEAHPVRTYEVLPHLRRSHVQPSEAYLATVRKGYEAHSLSPRHLETAAQGKIADAALNNLFAYGTLMRGECRFHVLAAQVEVALLAESRGVLQDLGAYPGMQLDAEGLHWVQGDFFKLSNLSVLADLDRIEGFPGFTAAGGLFRRRLTDVGMTDGRVRPAWVYVLAEEGGADPILSGSWRCHLGRQDTFTATLAEAHIVGREKTIIQCLQARWTLAVPAEVGECNLLPWVVDALNQGTLSERQLAQASGHWRAGA